MTLDPSAVGKEFGPVPVAWTSTDAIVYALGVGCADEEFCTENSEGVTQRVLPTFPLVLGQHGDPDRRADAPAARTSAMSAVGTFDPAMVVHGASSIAVAGPLPASGAVHTYTRIAAIWDKVGAGVVELETEGRDRESGAVLYTTGASVFIRGAGGFGGERGPSASRDAPPDRSPDACLRYDIRTDQALLYRLNGDRNPLHSDPSFARRAGFDRPILHGLCTFGFAGRALLHALCDGDPARFRSMRGRFAAPVLPGDPITVKVWADGGDARFCVERPDGSAAIDGGRCTYA